MLFLVKCETFSPALEVVLIISLICAAISMICGAIYFICWIWEYILEDFFDGIISKIKKMKQKRKDKKRDKDND